MLNIDPMTILNTPDTTDTPQRFSYRWLSAIFGLVTLLTFTIDRILLETSSISTGETPAYLLGGVVLAVGVSAFYASANDENIKTGLLLALGPVGGFAVYLLGYHLVLPPSTDSPTWLIFLAFAGGFVAVGVVGHLLGRLYKR
jgi:hypothetical protein